MKEGTIGRPLPGIETKVVDLDTGRDLGPNRSGMLLVRGPNVMKGYFGRPDLTAETVRDGWLITGDVAEIDEEGFIRITGRVSRFSKIGGEMVPHLRIEEAILSTPQSRRRPGIEFGRHGRAGTRRKESGWWFYIPSCRYSLRKSAAGWARAACRRCGFRPWTASAESPPYRCWVPASST